jgi:hypothetical protein
MLNILADALLIATGNRPQQPAQTRPRDTHWNDRFQPRPSQDLDRANVKRDLNW